MEHVPGVDKDRELGVVVFVEVEVVDVGRPFSLFFFSFPFLFSEEEDRGRRRRRRPPRGLRVVDRGPGGGLRDEGPLLVRLVKDLEPRSAVRDQERDEAAVSFFI